MIQYSKIRQRIFNPLPYLFLLFMIQIFLVPFPEPEGTSLYFLFFFYRLCYFTFIHISSSPSLFYSYTLPLLPDICPDFFSFLF